MAVADEPVTLRPFVAEEFRESFIEIYALEPELTLVTCIEVLSPSNKRINTAGWDLYQRKRQAMLLGEANFVEIDLLRGGTRLPMLDPWPASPYTVLVSRRDRAPGCKVWPAHSLRPLPTIPVPLSYPDPAVTLALQPLVDQVYSSAGYARSIDHSRPPAARLSPEEVTLISPAAPG